MSGSPRPRSAPPVATQPPIEFKPPLKPRRGLFVALCVAFGLWVGVLVALYVKTVYPMRHVGGATTSSHL